MTAAADETSNRSPFTVDVEGIFRNNFCDLVSQAEARGIRHGIQIGYVRGREEEVFELEDEGTLDSAKAHERIRKVHKKAMEQLVKDYQQADV